MNQIDVNSNDRHDAAAAWVARLDRGQLNAADEAQFTLWLASDSRNRGAFARARAAFAYVNYAGSLSTNSFADHSDFVAGASRRKVAAIAGAFAAAIALMVSFWPSAPSIPQLFESRKGEIRLVSLVDDSLLTLNTHSSVSVNYSDAQRQVELMDGEVSVIVAHDRSRPFTVTAGDLEVVAVGTSFLTRKIEGRAIEVLVQDGIVNVSYKGKELSVRADANTRVSLAEKGGVTTLVKQMMDPTAVARESAWIDGMISFEGATLLEAAAEFARYSDMQIVVDDPELQRKRITGLFSVHNPYRFSRAIADSLGLQLDVGQNELRLRR